MLIGGQTVNTWLMTAVRRHEQSYISPRRDKPVMPLSDDQKYGSASSITSPFSFQSDGIKADEQTYGFAGGKPG
jgi:hypothetical protein